VILTGTVLVVFMAHRSVALIEPDPDGLIRVSSSVSVDSVTVGQRFRVRHVFDYPDSLKMLDLSGIDPGSCRIISLTWKEESSKHRVARSADVTVITLDLEQARLPELVVDFRTPSGDTLRVVAEEIAVPVRHIVSEGADTKPLKAQWTAPRGYLKWAVMAVLALLVAGAVVFWMRRRRARVVEATPKPRLPADYVALTELTRIEKLDLIRAGRYKEFYTLVTRAVRQYILDRFGVDALDRTTRELLCELEAIGRRIERLEDLLTVADLVKFAKHLPESDAASDALTTARKIVVSTAPRPVVAGEPAAGSADSGGPTQEETAPGRRAS
jgi:hypothetical protein